MKSNYRMPGVVLAKRSPSCLTGLCPKCASFAASTHTIVSSKMVKLRVSRVAHGRDKFASPCSTFVGSISRRAVQGQSDCCTSLPMSLVDGASEMGKINIVPSDHAFTCQSAHSFLQVSMIDNAAESIRALYPNPCLNVLRLSSTSRNPIGNSVYNSPKM